MLDVLRKGAQTWVAKLLMGLLVVSFGVWGISGSVLNNFAGGNAVIKVGDVKVTPNEFRLAYNQDLAMMSRQFGTQLTREQAKQFGIEARVYSQLAAGAAIDQLANDMGLGLSQDQLAKSIAADPAFHDASGKFDRQTFSALLSNAGMTENDYIASRTQTAKRSQIIEAVGSDLKPPVTLVNAFLRYQNETRDIDYFLVTKDSVGPIKPPSDKELEDYFKANKAAYAAPEYRKIVYVTLTPQDIADPKAVSEDEAKAYYDAHKSDYGTPEQRTIDQLVFSDKAAADAAEAKLKSGTSFDELAKEQGKSATDIRLGTYTKAGFPEKSVADAAFAVPSAGGTTGVVQGPFGPVILRVTDIKPANVKDFKEVESDVRKAVAVEKANDRIQDVHDAYEDARAGGATLQEAAKKENLKPVVIDAVDSSGKAPDGNAVKSLPEQQDLLKAAFANEQGDEIPALNLGANGYLWVEVLGITPAHDRALKEVHDKVVANWTSDQVDAAMEKKADALKKEVEGGKKTMELAAAEIGAAVEHKAGIKRADSDAVLGQEAVNAAFSGPKGLVATAESADKSGKLVLKVTDVQQSTKSGYDALEPRQVDALGGRMSDDLFGEMVAQLQGHYGVSVNQNLGDQAVNY